jgi:uncharacterized protein CbrC (UPF0167 family)
MEAKEKCCKCGEEINNSDAVGVVYLKSSVTKRCPKCVIEEMENYQFHGTAKANFDKIKNWKLNK